MEHSAPMMVLAEQMVDAGISLNVAVSAFRRALIHKSLEKNKGNQCKTARDLGVHRNTLGRNMPRELKPGLNGRKGMQRAALLLKQIPYHVSTEIGA
jgi:Fis family transcriptional regulator, factor for inversion stimulation protein